MIPTLVRIPLALVVILIPAWALAWAGAWDAGRSLGTTVRELEGAMPSFPEREILLSGGEARAAALSSWTRLSLAGTLRLPDAPLRIAALHLAVAGRLAPLLAGLGSAGLLGGLILRERLRYAEGYASPAASHLARLMGGGSLLFLLVYATTPIPLPAWSLYPAGLGLTLGTLVYVANLPIRL